MPPVLAYLGGILTILSPCILPILPFTFARADRPFHKSGLPLLVGMVLTFAAVASIAVVGGAWAVHANQYGRWAALILFAVLGLSLLSSAFAERVSRPLVRLGNRLTQRASSGSHVGSESGVGQSLLLGVATGLLWAPCAGPILGLILTSAALQGANARTSLLLLMYAAGAATSLAVVLLAGGRVFAVLKRSLGADLWIRRTLGVAVLLGVAAVASGLDRGLLTRLSLGNTSGIEQGLLDRLKPRLRVPGQTLTITDTAVSSSHKSLLSSLSGATAWINVQSNVQSNVPPLTAEQLRGKVVLVDFWTYSCINCLRTLPYVRAWAEKYKSSGLVVIGVHTPEFPFEKNLADVEKAVRELGIMYPVALDNNYAIWTAFNNEYWPADYFFDANGDLRYHHFGEGAYDESERWIQELLQERTSKQPPPGGTVTVRAQGIEAAADMQQDKSPETYVGYQRAQHFGSPGGLKPDTPTLYALPSSFALNEWAFAGRWIDHGQAAVLVSPGGKIAFRFHARDLHLVLAPGAQGKPVPFRVTLDGRPPGDDHGTDTDARGDGVVTEDRLYQLIRQRDGIKDHIFKIEFPDPSSSAGVQAFAFTFG